VDVLFNFPSRSHCTCNRTYGKTKYISKTGGEGLNSLECCYLQMIEVWVNNKVVEFTKLCMTQRNIGLPCAVLKGWVTVSKHFLCTWSCHIKLCRPVTLCLLNCITETVQVTVLSLSPSLPLTPALFVQIVLYPSHKTCYTPSYTLHYLKVVCSFSQKLDTLASVLTLVCIFFPSPQQIKYAVLRKGT